MAATLLDGVELTQAEAKKIVKIAIAQNAYDSDMPDSKKGQIEAAHEIIAFCIDAWKNDNARPDDEDEEIAEGARAILDIFEIAGIVAEDDGTINYPDTEDEEEDEDEEEEDDDEEDDDEAEDEDEEEGDEADDDEEAAFEPDEYIEGYTELTTSSKIKAIKNLDPEDEDDYAALVAVADWEEQQDKPAARVLDVLADLIGEEEEEDEEEIEENEEETVEEPWPGYDKATAVDVKKTMNAAFEEGKLSETHINYVIEYENARPQPRSRILKLAEELLASLEPDEDEEEDIEEEEDEAPVRTSKRVKSAKSTNGSVTVTLTREQILTALDSGEVSIEIP